MHIRRLTIKNFKRFTDLTVDLSELATPPKLVLLIGANGSGKSSLFDAFEWLSQPFKDGGSFRLDDYHRKRAASDPQVNLVFTNDEQVKRVGNQIEGVQRESLFYGRSAIRQVSRLKRNALSINVDLDHDSDRPRYYIDLDERLENDFFLLLNRILSEVLAEEGTFETLRHRYINPINEALGRIFGTDTDTSLSLKNLALPANGKPGVIEFQKGDSLFHYDLLSSGEKEIFGVLLNLLIRRATYQDTIYFIDELDVHLNTSLQQNVLREITENWIPDGCQLWTASHSVGFIQYARNAPHAAILDVDQLNFDHPQLITPQPKESLEVFEVAVPSDVLFSIFDGRQIVLCEGKNHAAYNQLKLRNKVFLPINNKDEIFLRMKTNETYHGLVDRDYLTDEEISALREKYPKLFFLHYYTFENYLYHPNNMLEAVPGFDVATYRQEILRQKNERLPMLAAYIDRARNSYRMLKEEQLRSAEKDLSTNVAAIINALRSDEFETFYVFFNAKDMNRATLGAYNLNPARLAETKWFRTALEQLLTH